MYIVHCTVYKIHNIQKNVAFNDVHNFQFGYLETTTTSGFVDINSKKKNLKPEHI